MNIKLELYDKTKTYIFGTGKLATPEIVQETYPACKQTTFVVGTDEAGESFLSFNSLNKLRTQYGIDSSLTKEEAVAAIEAAMNATTSSTSTKTEVTAAERTAAALELIAMSTMPDVEEVV